jgi:hypothetical protein
VQQGAAAAVTAPTTEEIRYRRVRADIDATQPSAVVERRISMTEGDGSYVFLPYHSTEALWEQVCVTPCRVELDRFSSYRVSRQNHIAASREFTLPQGSDALQMQVQAGSLLAHRAGKVLTGTGIAALIVGAALIAGEHLFSSESDARLAGFVTGGAGLVLLAVGIPVSIATATYVVINGEKIALGPNGLAF